MRTKLTNLALTLVFLATLMLLVASPALASEEGEHGGDEELPVFPNGLTIAVVGIICLYAFLAIIILNVLRKRKKALQK